VYDVEALILWQTAQFFPPSYKRNE